LSKAIRDLLRMRPFDPDWALPSLLDDNPLVWMLNVNGVLMDIPADRQIGSRGRCTCAPSACGNCAGTWRSSQCHT
jgi:hypothetical protein